MTAESPDLRHVVQADRRPAIWPWLVMPMIALTAFYCLDRLAREAREQEELTPKPSATVQMDGATATGPSMSSQATDSGGSSESSDEESYSGDSSVQGERGDSSMAGEPAPK